MTDTSTTPDPAPAADPAEPATDLAAEVEKWKRFSRENESKAKANADAAKRLEAIESANATEMERAIKKARSEGAAEVQSAANVRLVSAEARALAAEAKFRNPSLAIKAIDLSGVTVSDDGAIDAAAIKTLLDDLAKDEPYLIDEGKVRPKEDKSQGGGQGEPSKTEEGKAQLRKRFPERYKQ